MTGALIHLALKCKWLNKSANSAADEQENSAADESALGVLPPRTDPLRMDPPWENSAADEIRLGRTPPRMRSAADESALGEPRCGWIRLGRTPLRMDPPWENPAADEIRPGTIRRGFVTESTQIRTQCYFHQLRNISSV